ncbi:TetR/AcrR family transcriptional regulator [Gordonia hirsuta]|uniref:TetR/AcrR family transcriptional regulator n=1 Tax=Gordonia hirsuta TaxID=53427 RepID=UPI00138ABBCB|nr:TetR/AcrR family transcriptional regulator [Gordonia hirsuta]
MTGSLPRTRPANRRELILAAATGLFVDRGYSAVSMAMIADEVGVRPSALYRHFVNKQAVLTEAFAAYVDQLCAALDGGHEADRLACLSARVLEHRYAGRLWIREARHLPASTADRIREDLLGRLDAVVAGAATESTRREVRARSTAVLAVFLSVATHHAEVAEPEVLTTLAWRAATMPERLPAHTPAPPGLSRTGTREQILSAAVALFAEHTYDGVGIDDIAAAVDLAPSSIYNHFSGKAEILAVLLHRANGYLQVTLDDVMRRAVDTGSALSAVAQTYAAFAVGHPALMRAIVAETGSLDEPDATLLRSAQRHYVAEWVRLYGGEPPSDRTAQARVTVMAAITAINELAQLPALARTAAGAAYVAGCGHTILGLPAPER